MKKKTLSRVFTALFLATAMLTTSVTTAFAEETESVVIEEVSNTSDAEVDGDDPGDPIIPEVVYSGSVSNYAFNTSAYIAVSTSKTAPKAKYSISGNSGTQYRVHITTPLGTTYTDYIYGNGSTHSHQFWTLATGTYYFDITPYNGSAGSTVYATISLS